MQKTKHDDHRSGQRLNLKSDGCTLAERIFLPPDRVAASAEYAYFDAYAAGQNISNEFHRRRTELTIDLGCGQGHITEKLHQVLYSAEFTGLDCSSKPISAGSLKVEVARRLFAMLISLVGSHHNLEATAFYLAKKATGTPEQTGGLLHNA